MGILSVSHLYNLYRITVETNLPKENFWHKKSWKTSIIVCHRCLVQIHFIFTIAIFLLNFLEQLPYGKL